MNVTGQRSRLMVGWSNRTAVKGLVCVAVVALLLLTLIFKSALVAAFRGGHTIQAEFSTDYNLRENRTKVKMAGLAVGVVTDVEPTSAGTSIVSMKVDDSAYEKLGPEPAARIDPLTVLGGQMSINLEPGGGGGAFDGERIPLARTSVPSELDRILESLPSDTRAALRRSTDHLAKTTSGGGTKALRGLMADGQKPIADAGHVFRALNGRSGSGSLQDLVADVHGMSKTLSNRREQVDRSLLNLDRTVAVLGREKRSLGATLDRMPSSLASTDAAMVALHDTLGRLDSAADRLKPTVEAAAPLVASLERALPQVRPLLADLKPVLRDARPLVKKLVPVTTQATGILNDVRGPVLDRVNDKILPMLAKPWHGEGKYAKSGRGVQADNKFYEEIGYMVTNLDRSSMVQDAQGSLLSFAVGVGLGTVQPVSLEEMLTVLATRLDGTR